jgi:hypothetical protein
MWTGWQPWQRTLYSAIFKRSQWYEKQPGQAANFAAQAVLEATEQVTLILEIFA